MCVCITYNERKPLCLKDLALNEDLRDLVAKLSCWYRPRLPSVHEPFVNANLGLLRVVLTFTIGQVRLIQQLQIPPSIITSTTDIKTETGGRLGAVGTLAVEQQFNTLWGYCLYLL